VRRVAAVMHRVAVLPLVDGLLGRAKALRQRRRGFRAGLDRRPHLWCRRRLLVEMEHIALATQGLSPQPARVTLSVPPSLASKWLIHHLPAYSRDHPGIDLRIIATEHHTDFRSDHVDLDNRIGPPPADGGLEVSLLSPVTLLAVATPAFAAALLKGPPLQLPDFSPYA
jgi:DNA-binding transcriptional LysR family regulator